MKLYFAPNSRAVRTAWLMEEIGLSYELERFSLGDKALRGPDYLAVNPNGRVPTLEDGDVRISESTAIAQYLVARYAPELAPAADDPVFPDYLQWLHYCEGMIMPPINNLVVETLLLPPDRRSEEHANRARKLLSRTLVALDRWMEGREYICGAFTAADTITGHSSIMSGRLGADMEPFANLRAYNERLLARPAAQRAFAL